MKTKYSPTLRTIAVALVIAFVPQARALDSAVPAHSKCGSVDETKEWMPEVRQCADRLTFGSAEADSVNERCMLSEKDPPRNEPCEEVTIVCSSDPHELDPRGCGEGTACCLKQECKMLLPQAWCDDPNLPCVKPGKVKRKDLLQCIYDSKPSTQDEALNLCTLRHELRHAENPAWWQDCSNEAEAYWAQIICLFNYYNQKCSTDEDRSANKAYCSALIGERCTTLGAHALQKCKCEQENSAPLTPCPACEASCNEIAQSCFKNFFPDRADSVRPMVEDFCRTQSRAYCDLNPNS